MESYVLSNKDLLTLNENIHKSHNYLVYFMISISDNNYVFFLRKVSTFAYKVSMISINICIKCCSCSSIWLKREILSATLNENNPHSRNFADFVWDLFISIICALDFIWEKSPFFLSSMNQVSLTNSVVTITWHRTFR